MKWSLPVSPYVAFWAATGLVRYINDAAIFRLRKNLLDQTGADLAQLKNDAAVLLPCYNEEVVLARTLESLKRLVPADQIHVISDGSTDRTAEIARQTGCQVLELKPGRGKAKALEAALEHFQICKRFKYVIMADADAIFGPRYLENALKIFTLFPDTAAIAGYARTPWVKHWRWSWRMFYVAYRVRMYRIFQWLLTYGWTWRHANVSPVIPGFASIYRTKVLQQLAIDVPGLIIEDFNLAFQVHKKKLGKIAHHPSVYAIDQDPDNLNDYMRQLRRWNVGYWQTVKHNGVWPSKFWLSQGWFAAEVLLYSLLLVALPAIIFILTLTTGRTAEPVAVIGGRTLTSFHVFVIVVYSGLFLVDYMLSLVVAAVDRRYMLAVYGLAFPFIRVIDALVLLSSLKEGLFSQSAGRWRPPTRYTQITSPSPPSRQ